MAGQHFYRNWIAANALGEVLGLGVAALIAVAVAQAHGLPPAEEIVVVTAAFLVIGAYEGAIVGAAQWLVLRFRQPRSVAAETRRGCHGARDHRARMLETLKPRVPARPGKSVRRRRPVAHA